MFVKIDDDSCNWYAVDASIRCIEWGDCCKNDGYTANTACCVCGGGIITEEPNDPTKSPTKAPVQAPRPTKTPTKQPTKVPTKAPVKPICTNVSNWRDSDNDGCNWYTNNDPGCDDYGDCCKNQGYTANEACCFCGGGTISTLAPMTDPPTAAPVTEAPTNTPVTPFPTKSPATSAPTNIPTQSPTMMTSKSPTEYPTILIKPTKAPVNPFPTKTPVTSTPTSNPTQNPTTTPSKLPTQDPTISLKPVRYTSTPSTTPTQSPKSTPSNVPVTIPPTESPTKIYTEQPTKNPTRAPVEPICTNISNWRDSDGDGCNWYTNNDPGCDDYGSCCERQGYTANEACCFCGGGILTYPQHPTKAPAQENLVPTNTPFRLPVQDGSLATGDACLANDECVSGICNNGACMASGKCKYIKHDGGQFSQNRVNIVFVGSAFQDLEDWKSVAEQTMSEFANFEMFQSNNDLFNIFYVDELFSNFCYYNCGGVDNTLCCNTSLAHEYSNLCFPTGSMLQTSKCVYQLMAQRKYVF